MAKECAITGKTSKVVGSYSNRIRATQFNPTGKVRKYPNVTKKRIYVPELKSYVTINVSAKGLKIIHKKGAYKALKDVGLV